MLRFGSIHHHLDWITVRFLAISGLVSLSEHKPTLDLIAKLHLPLIMVQTSVSALSSPADPPRQSLKSDLDRQEAAAQGLPKKDGRHRIGIYEEAYVLLRTVAQREGRPMSQVAADAILAYVNTHS